MLKRQPFNVVVTALANKMARTISALLAYNRLYHKGQRQHQTSVSKAHGIANLFLFFKGNTSTGCAGISSEMTKQVGPGLTKPEGPPEH